MECICIEVTIQQRASLSRERPAAPRPHHLSALLSDLNQSRRGDRERVERRLHNPGADGVGREAHGLSAEGLGDALLFLGALDLLEQPQHDEVRVRELRQLRDVPLDLREDGQTLLVMNRRGSVSEVREVSVGGGEHEESGGSGNVVQVWERRHTHKQSALLTKAAT